MQVLPCAVRVALADMMNVPSHLEVGSLGSGIQSRFFFLFPWKFTVQEEGPEDC